jgi:hypothetical protein
LQAAGAKKGKERQSTELPFSTPLGMNFAQQKPYQRHFLSLPF